MSARDDQLIDRYYFLLREYNEKEYQEPRDPRRAHEHDRSMTKMTQELASWPHNSAATGRMIEKTRHS